MKKTILTLALCLAALVATAQNRYEVEQRLEGDIEQMELGSGWDIRLIHDTLNSVVIVTPCEYYFAEGNEPEICTLKDGWFTLKDNNFMPHGTRVEIHHSRPLTYLRLENGASASSDSLAFTSSKNWHEMMLYPTSRLDVRVLYAERPLYVAVDTMANLHIGTLDGNKITISTKKYSTVNIDDSKAIHLNCVRHPESYGNLPELAEKNEKIEVKTANRWIKDQLHMLTGGFAFGVTNYFDHHTNSPFNSNFGAHVSLTLMSNEIYFTNRLWFNFGWTMGMEGRFLTNDVEPADHHLQLATTPTDNRQYQILWNNFFGIPIQMGYSVKHYIAKHFISNVHIGLTPMLQLGQGFKTTWLNSHDHFKSDSEKVRDLSTFQLRLTVGIKLPVLMSMRMDFFVDLLPTYRPSAEAGNIHSFGLRFTF